ncbi:MAG: 5'/3'-nucleotidase SurE [Candidatus Omnitrophica bacterium]|nr:5'/3'-nucleotidase SurE [Candidatus Omnitrophota bacterium]
MHILLTNDDGINAEGLYELYRRLHKKFKVTVCAPEAEQSAIGHAITLNKPLRVKEIYKSKKFYGYAVDGTPADCVKIAIRCILKEKPQMVISGINHGPNLGSDVMYSGTVSAATEGTILGIPSLAFSLATYENYNFRFAAEFATLLATKIKKTGLPDGVLLNVNVPSVAADRVRGVMITKQGRSFYKESFLRRVDPRGRKYYWLTGKVKWLKKPKDSDIKAVEERYISVTPLQFDLTDYRYVDILKNTGIGL